MSRTSRIILGAAVVALSCAPNTSATWSIILVDRATGEVAVAGATCIAGDDLKNLIPVLYVGKGAGAAQSATHQPSRRAIGRELDRGTSPEEILQIILQDGDPRSRQFGIVDMSGQTISYTGELTAAWSGHRNGTIGTLSYAIQGNVLTSAAVVEDAERALLTTPGPLPERMMAAMLAAAHAGGDNRCSRSLPKSSHIAFMVVSRLGDDDGFCPFKLCINGDYFLELNVANTLGTDPDPVFIMNHQLQEWRFNRRQKADHLNSRTALSAVRLPADGVSMATMTLRLADYFEDPIHFGGHSISVQHEEGSDGISVIGTPVDRGDGIYTIPLLAGNGIGKDVFRVEVRDPPLNLGDRPTRLHPPQTLEYHSPLRLFGDRSFVDVSRGESLELSLHAPIAMAGLPYLVLASLSGSGETPIGGTRIPLSIDSFTHLSFRLRNQPPFLNTQGTLDAQGFAVATLSLVPDQLIELIGEKMTFAWVPLSPIDQASTPFTIEIDP